MGSMWRRGLHSAAPSTCSARVRVRMAAVAPPGGPSAGREGRPPRARLFDRRPEGEHDAYGQEEGQDKQDTFEGRPQSIARDEAPARPFDRDLSKVMRRSRAPRQEGDEEPRGGRRGGVEGDRRGERRWEGSRERAALDGQRQRAGGSGWQDRDRRESRDQRGEAGRREPWRREPLERERGRGREEAGREGARASRMDRVQPQAGGTTGEGLAETQGPAAQQQQQQQQQDLRRPNVRPLLDLPVVRDDRGDKGTFYAPRERWDELGLTKDVVDALRSLGFRRPSHVQAAALQAWRRADSQHLALADQAGSGKTLGYLLPLVQIIRSQDAAAGKPCTVPKCPRAIIVTPTVELVQQVYRVAKALSNAGARMRVVAMTGGQEDPKERARSVRTQRELLDGGVDVLVATPGRLVEHLKAGNVELSACRGLVLDEVDVLLGDTTAFEAQMAPLREAAPPSLRFVLVTATLPQHTADLLRQSFNDITLVTGPGLHRTATGLVEELVDCSGGEEVSLESGVARKLEALHQVLRSHKADRTLVFCNKIESCRDVENELRRKYKSSDLRVLVYHEAVRPDLRQAAMNAFLSPVGREAEPLQHLERYSGPRAASRAAGPSTQLADGHRGEEGMPSGAEGARPEVVQEEEGEKAPRLVMVATDRMSRGIDSMYCQHVVLFDFPRDPSEYVRRVGRTARGAGGTGVVSALVLGRQVALAREIMGRNEKGQPIHRLPRL